MKTWTNSPCERLVLSKDRRHERPLPLGKGRVETVGGDLAEAIDESTGGNIHLPRLEFAAEIQGRPASRNALVAVATDF